jgi:membrane protein DedA with SNARE-associated domain
MEELLIQWLCKYGYIILFLWCMLEGEMGLVMGGLLCHTGHLWYPLALLVAGLGGFAGDQIYFYIGRLFKDRLHRHLRRQRRKFAIAHLLLLKYGWPVIFVQRYLYGLRTVLPMAMGLTKYSAKRFALINLISALVWATITITPAFFFGEELLVFLKLAKRHWYIAIPFAGTLAYLLYRVFDRIEQRMLDRRKQRQKTL